MKKFASLASGKQIKAKLLAQLRINQKKRKLRQQIVS